MMMMMRYLVTALLINAVKGVDVYPKVPAMHDNLVGRGERMMLYLVTAMLVNANAVAGVDVYPDVNSVHVINSCHLDIGFADSSANIVNEYFHNYLPKAAVTTVHGMPLRFMFQSWIVDLFFSCEENFIPIYLPNVICPNKTEIDLVTKGIASESITWHAFPHNAQLEIMSEYMLDAGFELTRQLDEKFNQPAKNVLSQRDVPGITVGAIPTFKRNNISGVSIGCNDGTTPPSVPPCFLWKDTASSSGDDILGLFNWPGYGRISADASIPIEKQQMFCRVESFDHALIYNWNGDNAGPFDQEEYERLYARLALSFPNADIFSSTFSNFTGHLETVREKLPVVSEEIGDSWIYGVPSDPQKVSRMRAMGRAWKTFVDSAFSGNVTHAMRSDSDLLRATKLALKLGEHTWGKDVKKNLVDNDSWRNDDFERAKAKGSSNASQYEALELSWWEQRAWGIASPIDLLTKSGHPLADLVRDEFDQLRPRMPATKNGELGKVNETYTCDGVISLAFNEEGAISYLEHESSIWASEEKTLVRPVYRSYSAQDVQNFFSTYVRSNQSWVEHDYGKPNLPKVGVPVGQLWTPRLKSIFLNRTHHTSSVCSFLLEWSFEDVVHREYGGPAVGFTRVDIDSEERTLNVTLSMFNKTTTRLPEAMFVQFQVAPAVDDSETNWEANKLGQWIGPANIVDGGTKHLHGVSQKGLRASRRGGAETLEISSVDFAVANFGALQAYPSPINTTADTKTHGASFVLWDNLWGTNYVMWWPFVVPPPDPYASCASYFPVDGNSDMIGRLSLKL